MSQFEKIDINNEDDYDNYPAELLTSLKKKQSRVNSIFDDDPAPP